MPGTRGKTERKPAAEFFGLRLCECCFKENEESLKSLGVLDKQELTDINKEIQELKIILRRNEDIMVALEEQKGEIHGLKSKIDDMTKDSNKKWDQHQQATSVLKTKIDDLTKDSLKKLNEHQQASKEWSSLFKEQVDLLVTDVGVVQKSVAATKNTFELNSDRLNRKNNVVAYNLPENDSKSKDKDTILRILKEITDRDLDKEIIDVFRMGKRGDETQRPRPILVKFENQSIKNLVLENSYRLRKSEVFRKVILNQDLTKEDRELCKKLLDEKKKDIGLKDDVNKWVFRVRGHPGDFHVVTYKKQNL